MRRAMSGQMQPPQQQQQQTPQPTAGNGTQGGDAGRSRMSASDAVNILGILE
jgi:hypothetical protein